MSLDAPTLTGTVDAAGLRIGIVASRFQAGSHEGAIGVLGPARLNYSRVIPMVRYFGRIIAEITHE